MKADLKTVVEMDLVYFIELTTDEDTHEAVVEWLLAHGFNAVSHIGYCNPHGTVKIYPAALEPLGGEG